MIIVIMMIMMNIMFMMMILMMMFQVMYSCLVHSGWWEHLGPLTCLGLLIACLCHDVDHRGKKIDINQP